MHKEIKRGKKTIAIIVSLLTITVTLYIYINFLKLILRKILKLNIVQKFFLL